MKTFYIICLLLACQSIITGLSAQTVSGKLVDEKNEPMPYANVVLLSLPDSAFVSGTISGDDGTFSLSATAQPQIVRISSIGYTTIYRPVNPADMGIVRLTADTHQLGEVTVKADLPKMRLKGDAMVTTANCEAGTTNRLSLTPIWTSYGNKRWMPHTPRQNAAT